MAHSILKGLTALIVGYHFIVILQLPTWLNIFVYQSSHRAISLMSAIILVFWLIPAKSSGHFTSSEPRRIPWYDIVLMLMAVLATGYVAIFIDRIYDYTFSGRLDTIGYILAFCLVVPLFEAVRRLIGLALPLIIITVVALTLLQPYLPGILYGRGVSYQRLVYSAYVSDVGVFGLPLGIAANVLMVFLIFGALMQISGAGSWIVNLALALTGWSRGGPAKAAVVASAMFGSISGSPTSNAATSGVFSIPMMIKIGYKPKFAAATEGVASTGGMILPPVMGAIAFIMAEWIGVSYAEVVKAATIPALLYFLIIFVSIHSQAGRDGIRSMRREDIPNFKAEFTKGWFYLIPIGALIYFLIVARYSPGIAGAYSAFFVIGASFLSKDRVNWLTPSKILEACLTGTRRWVIIAVITGIVGIMIGSLELSGLGIRLSRSITQLAGGNLILTLILVGLLSLIVGMGLDATPAYVTLATLTAPALVMLGVTETAAHLFVIYWGLASFFTPPTCLALFATAAIAGSNIWQTGWEAMRLGVAAFLIPFAFVLNDGLLMQGSVSHILIAATTAGAGAILLALGIRGYWLGMVPVILRIVLIGAGILLIAPGVILASIGAGLGLSVMIWQGRSNRGQSIA